MTKEKALKKAKKDYWFLKDHPEWNNDKEIVLAAVQKDGCALEYTSDELKNDKEVVMAAVQQDGDALLYASNQLKNDKEVVLAAVQQYGEALQYASDELKSNKEFILTVIQQNGMILEYASDELRRNRKIVLAAIANDINAYKFSLLEGYQDFNEIVEKEGEDFLFSCWNNLECETRLQVANHPNFLPTLEQVEVGLKDWYEKVKNIYQLRRDEWLAKIEENKLRNTI